MSFKNQLKIFSGVVIVVCACIFTMVYSASSLGIKTMATMDCYGIIEDKAEWNKILRETNYGEKVDTPEEASSLINRVNKHSTVTKITSDKDWKKTDVINYPSISKYDGLTIINVPGAYTHKDEKYPTKYIKKLADLIDQTSGNIVLNLSNNPGGLSEPMILGASALIPDGTIFSEVDNHKERYPVVLRQGGLSGGFPNTINSSLKVDYKRNKKKLNTKVAVIANKYTGSAAEHLLLALKTNPNVKIFGLPSAGYTSVNSSELFSSEGSDDEWFMVYTVGYLKAAKPINGQSVFNNQKIEPDNSVKFSSTKDYKQDVVSPKENEELFGKIGEWFGGR